MPNVFDVAKYILETKGPMTAWTLHYLLYFAQAYSLAWHDEELFPEEFEANAWGPCCPEIRAWVSLDSTVKVGNIPSEHLTSKGLAWYTEELIDDVLEHFDTIDDMYYPHQVCEGDPWKIARKDVAPGQSCDNIISKEDMRWYYIRYIEEYNDTIDKLYRLSRSSYNAVSDLIEVLSRLERR